MSEKIGKVLLDIVSRYREEEFPGIILQKASWPVTYHLSPLRESLLNWIPFRTGEKILEMGSGCGAVTGALMALGLYGIDDPKEANAFCRRFKEAHDGFLDCRDLLRISAERGEVKKAHCDALVYECVELVEKMIENKG